MTAHFTQTGTTIRCCCGTDSMLHPDMSVLSTLDVINRHLSDGCMTDADWQIHNDEEAGLEAALADTATAALNGEER
jgi:hypothetical protein